MWILVLLVYAGTFAKGDSVALLEVPGFATEAKCNEAGRKGDKLVVGTSKDVKFVCIRKD